LRGRIGSGGVMRKQQGRLWAVGKHFERKPIVERQPDCEGQRHSLTFRLLPPQKDLKDNRDQKDLKDNRDQKDLKDNRDQKDARTIGTKRTSRTTGTKRTSRTIGTEKGPKVHVIPLFSLVSGCRKAP